MVLDPKIRKVTEPLEKLLQEHDVFLTTWRDQTGLIANDVTQEQMKVLPYIRTAGILHDRPQFKFLRPHLVGVFPYRIKRDKFVELLPKIRKTLDKIDNTKTPEYDPEAAKIGWGIFYTVVLFGLVWGCVEYSSRIEWSSQKCDPTIEYCSDASTDPRIKQLLR